MLIPAIFFYPPKNIVDPRDPYDLYQSLSRATH